MNAMDLAQRSLASDLRFAEFSDLPYPQMKWTAFRGSARPPSPCRTGGSPCSARSTCRRDRRGRGVRKRSSAARHLRSLAVEQLESRYLLAASLFPSYQLPVGKSPGVVLSDDLDGDGHADLSVSGSGTITLFRGTGSGEFDAGADVSVPASSRLVATADFNEDGHLDFAMDYSSGLTQVAVVLSDGSGSFLPRKHIESTGSLGPSLRVTSTGTAMPTS